jgi:hypothetical protein
MLPTDQSKVVLLYDEDHTGDRCASAEVAKLVPLGVSSTCIQGLTGHQTDFTGCKYFTCASVRQSQLECDHDELKRSTFQVNVAPNGTIVDLDPFNRPCTKPQLAQIVTYGKYAIAIGNSEQGRRLASQFVPEEMRNEAESDRFALKIDDYLKKYQDFVVESPDWLIEDMGGNRG